MINLLFCISLLWGVAGQAKTENIEFKALCNTEKSQLQTLANSSTTTEAAIQAQNILCFINGSNCDLPTLPNLTPATGSGKQISTNPQADINKLLTTVTVYPNPASDYVSFAYQIPSQAVGIATLLVTDPAGKPIVTLMCKDLNGELLWDTRTIPQGVYYYSLVFGTEQLVSGSLSIVHK